MRSAPLNCKPIGRDQPAECDSHKSEMKASAAALTQPRFARLRSDDVGSST